MNPEKISNLTGMLNTAGVKEQQEQAAQLERLSEMWKANKDNIQKRYKDSDSETGFYLYVKDILNKAKPKTK
jgi:hypothetical protein